MTKVSISEAARLTGKPRSTLHRHIGNGTLSKESDGQGKPVLDVAELERVYGPLLQADMKQRYEMHHPATPATGAADRAEIEGLRRENVRLYSQLEDVKQERHKWQQEADSWRQQATALLTDQTRKPAAEPERPAPRGFRAFLHRLTG